MNIILSPQQEKFIQSQISQGKYTNMEEVIDSALKLLEKQDYEQWLDETRQKVQVGLEQLEKGEKIDGEIVIAQLKAKFQQMREENLSE